MNKVIVITGQTAVGKTSLSEKLAKIIDGEIINGDAMQVYKQLNILTAKIKDEEKENVNHHLFDIKDITDDYSVEEYQQKIREVIDDVLKRNKTPIIVGGTGLYIKAALYDYVFNKSNLSHEQIEKKYEKYSNDQLYEILKKIDLKAANKIHKNNRRRVIRAISIYETTGISKSETIDQQNHNLIYDALIFALYLPKDQLIENINKRVDMMVQEGLIDEVKNNKTISTASKAIGYKEIQEYLNGNITLDEALNLIKVHTRQYAKRQMTFFKHQFNTIWIENDSDALNNILKYISKSNGGN